MNYIYISYCAEDCYRADVIRDYFKGKGIILRCPAEERAVGADLSEYIPSAVKEAKAVLFLLSEKAQGSRQIARELYFADKYSVPIIPIRWSDVTVSDKIGYYLCDCSISDVSSFESDYSVLDGLYERLNKILRPDGERSENLTPLEKLSEENPENANPWAEFRLPEKYRSNIKGEEDILRDERFASVAEVIGDDGPTDFNFARITELESRIASIFYENGFEAECSLSTEGRAFTRLIFDIDIDDDSLREITDEINEKLVENSPVDVYRQGEKGIIADVPTPRQRVSLKQFISDEALGYPIGKDVNDNCVILPECDLFIVGADDGEKKEVTRNLIISLSAEGKYILSLMGEKEGALALSNMLCECAPTKENISDAVAYLEEGFEGGEFATAKPVVIIDADKAAQNGADISVILNMENRKENGIYVVEFVSGAADGEFKLCFKGATPCGGGYSNSSAMLIGGGDAILSTPEYSVRVEIPTLSDEEFSAAVAVLSGAYVKEKEPVGAETEAVAAVETTEEAEKVEEPEKAEEAETEAVVAEAEETSEEFVEEVEESAEEVAEEPVEEAEEVAEAPEGAEAQSEEPEEAEKSEEAEEQPVEQLQIEVETEEVPESEEVTEPEEETVSEEAEPPEEAEEEIEVEIESEEASGEAEETEHSEEAEAPEEAEKSEETAEQSEEQSEEQTEPEQYCIEVTVGDDLAEETEEQPQEEEPAEEELQEESQEEHAGEPETEEIAEEPAEQLQIEVETVEVTEEEPTKEESQEESEEEPAEELQEEFEEEPAEEPQTETIAEEPQIEDTEEQPQAEESEFEEPAEEAEEPQEEEVEETEETEESEEEQLEATEESEEVEEVEDEFEEEDAQTQMDVELGAEDEGESLTITEPESTVIEESAANIGFVAEDISVYPEVAEEEETPQEEVTEEEETPQGEVPEEEEAPQENVPEEEEAPQEEVPEEEEAPQEEVPEEEEAPQEEVPEEEEAPQEEVTEEEETPQEEVPEEEEAPQEEVPEEEEEPKEAPQAAENAEEEQLQAEEQETEKKEEFIPAFVDPVIPHELYLESLRLFITKGQASINILQRRPMYLNYSRASAIFKWAIDEGYVSDPNSYGISKVYITMDKLRELFG